MKNFKKRKILIGISGGIAVYKIASLTNFFIKGGAEVKIIMTNAATKFVSPLTFQTLTNKSVYLDMFQIMNTDEVEHVALAHWCDIFVLAPATANTIGKIANGIADNLLSTVIMALPSKTRVVLAPAMNVEMWNNPIFKNNINILNKFDHKYIIIEPRSGILACKTSGVGKIADNETILDVVYSNLK